MRRNLEDFDDRDLIAASRDEPDAFAVFYRRHVDHVLGFFLTRTGRGELALDLTAETFAAALASAHRYKPSGAPAEAWLYAIARHKLAHVRRRGQVDERVRRRLQMEPMGFEDADLEAVERRAATGHTSLMKRLEELPKDQRRAVGPHIIEERDYDDIASEMRCSSSVVRKRVSRALQALRLNDEGGVLDG